MATKVLLIQIFTQAMKQHTHMSIPERDFQWNASLAALYCDDLHVEDSRSHDGDEVEDIEAMWP